MAELLKVSPDRIPTWLERQLASAKRVMEVSTSFTCDYHSIQAAADLAEPGDLIFVHPGVYRECVMPARGGEEGAPIRYVAAPWGEVRVRGSEAVSDCFEPVAVSGNTFWRCPLGELPLTSPNACLQGFRSYDDEPVRPADGELLEPVRALLFVDGEPQRQALSFEEWEAEAGSWFVDHAGEHLWLHLPADRMERSPCERLVELAVRNRIFGSKERFLGHIHIRGFTFEHCANNHPTPQIAAVSTRAGHHWRIEDCTIRHAATAGLDIGVEWGIEDCPEGAGLPVCPVPATKDTPSVPDTYEPGHHVVCNNRICDNGLTGLIGLLSYGVVIRGNTFERNNCLGFRTWEVGALKVHYFLNGLIEGNVVRDNDCFGLWLDNGCDHSRVCRNLVVNNQYIGLFVEMGAGPVMLDHNIVALTRGGEGIYLHDASRVTIAHNLIYGNAHFGVYATVATDRRLKEGDVVACRETRVLNNLILANKGGAVSFPTEWERAHDNLSEGNVFMGSGASSDEGSGPNPSLFHFNSSHARFQPRAVHAQIVGADRFIGERFEVDQLRHPCLELKDWRILTGNDQESLEWRLLREGFQPMADTFTFDVGELLVCPVCEFVEGLQTDYQGFSLRQHERPLLPGPFQSLSAGKQRYRLSPTQKGQGRALPPIKEEARAREALKGLASTGL